MAQAVAELSDADVENWGTEEMSLSNDPVEVRLAEIRTFLDALTDFECGEARDHLARMEEYVPPLSEAAEKLLDAVLDLDYQEQLAIVQKVQLIHSRPPGVMSADDPRFPDVLAERLRRHESGEDKGVPAAEVMGRMRAKFQHRDAPPPAIIADSQD